MNGLTVGSLFAGIGGFDLGFERAGCRTVWQVEQNAFCRAVLERHFPDAERFEDVREVGAAELQPVDVICGGFPCQDISLAGKGAGIDGARSGLWSEYARIVRELEPRWVVVENVPALLGRGLDRVLRDLASIGYDAEWDCLPASAFGAPHQRDRLWLVAYPDADESRRGVLTEHHGRSVELGGSASRRHADGLRDEVADPTSLRRGPGRQGRSPGEGQDGAQLTTPGMADPDGERWHGPGQQRSGRRQPADCGPQSEPAGTGITNGWPPEPAVGRVVDGFPGRVDQLRALGNALVPAIAEWIGRRIVNYETAQTPERAA